MEPCPCTQGGWPCIDIRWARNALFAGRPMHCSGFLPYVAASEVGLLLSLHRPLSIHADADMQILLVPHSRTWLLMFPLEVPPNKEHPLETTADGVCYRRACANIGAPPPCHGGVVHVARLADFYSEGVLC